MIGFIHGLFVGSCLLAAAGIAVHSKSTIKYDLAHFGTTIHQLKTVGVITPAQAKEIIVSDAGVSINDVAFTNVYHKYENGYDIIKVEFKKGDTDYKYEIDAASGTILNIHIDFE